MTELDEIAVNAQSEHIVTHIPEVVHVKNHLDQDFLNSLNLLSSPAFLILRNKKLPNLTAQIIIEAEIIISPKIESKLTLFEYKT